MPRRNFDLDRSRRFEEFEREGRSFMDFPSPWMQAYMAAEEPIFDEYIAAGDYDDAMLAILKANGPSRWKPSPPQKGTQAYLVQLSGKFEELRHYEKLKKLWRRTIAKRKPFLWKILKAIAKTPPRKKLALAEGERYRVEFKDCVLAAMNEYRAALERIGDELELAKLQSEIDEVVSEQRRTVQVELDPRRMDEEVFWSVIEKSRKGTDGFSEQVERLTALLTAFKPSDIARFQRILNGKLKESCRQDLWAVAYIVGGGCSDDGFEYFRGALIASGRKRYDAALESPEKAAVGLDSASDYSCEEILYAASEAYMQVKGEDLYDMVKPIEPKLKGKHWEEEDLPAMFPRLCKRFGYSVSES